MPLSNLLHDRTARAFALASALIALWAWRGPLTKHNHASQQLVRHEWKQCADVVVVGDSTVRQGIYADTVEHALGDTYRVANFGYPAQAIADAEYLTSAEAVLDPSNPDRAIVISVSSWNTSVIASAVFHKEGTEVAQAIERGQRPSVELDWRETLDVRLASRGLCGLLWNACPWQNARALGRGGQFVVDPWREDETRDVPTTLHEFDGKGNAFPPEAIEPLYARIRELRQRGVHVFAYVERDRPLVAAITEAHGYEPDRIERRLRETGAIVIGFPTDLPTRDGTHMTHAAAQRWSAVLGAALANALPRHDHLAPTRCAWPDE